MSVYFIVLLAVPVMNGDLPLVTEMSDQALVEQSCVDHKGLDLT